MTGAVFDLNDDNAHVITALPAIGCALIGLVTMIVFTQIVEGKSEGTDKMKDLAAKIHKGAVDFLVTEYKFLAGFVVCIFTGVSCMLIGAKDSSGEANNAFGVYTAIPVLIGATLSAFAGWR